jgi:hypothetical protein
MSPESVCSGFGMKTCAKSRTYSRSRESLFTRPAVEFLRPLARTVLHEQNFEALIGHAVSYDIWRTYDHKLSRAFDSPIRPMNGLADKSLSVLS